MCWSHAPLHTFIDWLILSGGKWLLVRHLFELVEIAGAFETLGPDAALGTRLNDLHHRRSPARLPDVRRHTPRRSIHASSDHNKSPLLSMLLAPLRVPQNWSG